jgi:hypothetical protein
MQERLIIKKLLLLTIIKMLRINKIKKNKKMVRKEIMGKMPEENQVFNHKRPRERRTRRRSD